MGVQDLQSKHKELVIAPLPLPDLPFFFVLQAEQLLFRNPRILARDYSYEWCCKKSSTP